MAGRRATEEDVKRYPGTRVGDFLIDNSINNEGGLAAYYAHVRGSNDPERADRQLTSAGNNFRQKFKELVGRDANDSEVSRFFQDVLVGSDVGLVDRQNELRPVLNSYVADTYSTMAQDEQKKNLGEKAKAEYGTVGELFKSVLGRDATSSELDHFAKLKADGTADDYTLGEALKTLPEYLEKQDSSARENLRGELSNSDQRFFNDSVLPSIQSRFAQQGRTVDGSGFAAALGNAAKDISNERETYLAGLGREDYVNRRQQAIGTYLNNLDRTYAQQDYAKQRNDGLTDTYRNRAYELQNYDIQKRAYDDYLRNSGNRKKSGLLGGIGSLAGAGAGAFFGGMPGAYLGSQLGGAGGSLFDNY